MDKAAALTQHEACMNCGVKIVGKFCMACGQRDADLRRPFWAFFKDFIEDTLELDTRFFHSIVPLLFQPGLMSRKYVEGKRAHYVPPLRFYLITSLLFFLIVGVADIAIIKFVVTSDDAGFIVSADDNQDQQTAIEKIEAQLADLPENEADMTPGQKSMKRGLETALENATEGGSADTNFSVEMFVPIGDGTDTATLPEDFLEVDTGDSPEGQDFGDGIERGIKTAVGNPARLNDLFERWLPRAMVLILPIFALILRLFYWGKGKKYFFNQLVFSLHFHTFMFFLLNVVLVAEIFFPGSVSGWIFLGAIALYLFVGLKVMSQQGWFRTTFKFIFISLFYIIALSTILLGAFVWGLQEL